MVPFVSVPLFHRVLSVLHHHPPFTPTPNNHPDDGYDDSADIPVNFGLSFPVQFCKSAMLTPFMAYGLPIDALGDAGEDEQLHGGVMISVRYRSPDPQSASRL